jgi:hypothetical protein
VDFALSELVCVGETETQPTRGALFAWFGIKYDESWLCRGDDLFP